MTVRQKLTAVGHIIDSTEQKYGNMQAVVVDSSTGVWSAGSDPRGIGTARASNE